ncbi:hypothetical protein O0I10_006687 [Lichtheimia ornata]|uniref:Reverse transcriptase RNase H-like domain-containing protein n=1 Tax=Lichtheimia ornata TaxID=688661 RepID=A0AAD7Y0T6_9FUNG|nr:uncharacterized protein O0I10_006687 [Lichtheimia ornata]KAJ8657622.1 hypothetical protein O0I10_006687 [Lichtheimia ornata]
MLAIIHALRTWRCFIDGRPYTVFSDHNPLTYFRAQKKPTLLFLHDGLEKSSCIHLTYNTNQKENAYLIYCQGVMDRLATADEIHPWSSEYLYIG